MAATVVITDIIKAAPPSTTVRVKFGDGTELEFQSIQDVTDAVADVDNVDGTRLVAIAWIKARSADLSNIAQIKNKNFTFDLSTPSPIKVQ